MTRTEPLFRRVARLDNLNDTRTERLDSRRVVGEDTHVTSRRREVHLNDISGSEDGLAYAVKDPSRKKSVLAHAPGGGERGTG